MNIKLTIIAAVILSLVTVVSGPAFVGAQNTDAFVLNVTKVVEGPGNFGPYGFFVICGVNETHMGIEDGRTIPIGVEVGEPIAFNEECLVVEDDPFGADIVTYTCEATMDTTCVDDQTVAFDVSDAGGVGSITITNTFVPEPPPEAAPDAAAAQPGAVAAQPAFTG